MSDFEHLQKLGFEYSSAALADDSIPETCVPVRVTQVQKESYFVTDGTGEVYAEVTGRLMYGADSSLDLPVTGDWVLAQIVDSNLAIIHSVLQRKSILQRKSPGKKTDLQAIASNIDTALLVQAVDEDFSLRRLERYLVMCREGNIAPLVLLSKIDLINENELLEKTESVQEVVGDIPVIAFSCENGEGLEELTAQLNPTQTYCLLGSSGVGKSTLLNQLAGTELKETQEIRESDGKGRHTTTARHLIVLDSGVLLIDTPGMRELGTVGASTGISETFSDIEELFVDCRFVDCTHEHESGCAVQEALEDGVISEERFRSFLKMKKESEHNERSFLEKKRHDKSLGKMYKSVQKGNRKLKNN